MTFKQKNKMCTKYVRNNHCGTIVYYNDMYYVVIHPYNISTLCVGVNGVEVINEREFEIVSTIQ
jgi:hypothetical protein